MDLQLVPVPVTDVDRGSGCAIVFGTGMGPITDMQPGSVKGLHLVVDDINTAREALLARGIEVGGVDDLGGVLYASFEDPDGNLWLLQQWPRTAAAQP